MSEKQISGAIIDVSEAKSLVHAFKIQYPNLITASVIDASLLRQLIDQVGCTEVRIYNGYDTILNKFSPVLIGVNENDDDMMGVILERTRPCPPYRGISGLEED